MQLLNNVADTFIISNSQAIVSISNVLNQNTNIKYLIQLSFLVDDIVLLPKSSNFLVRGITVNVGFQSVIRGVASLYTLSLTDGNLCSSSFEVNITHPESMFLVSVFNIKFLLIICLGLSVVSDVGRPGATVNNGSISLNVFGGIPPYQYP